MNKSITSTSGSISSKLSASSLTTTKPGWRFLTRHGVNIDSQAEIHSDSKGDGFNNLSSCPMSFAFANKGS